MMTDHNIRENAGVRYPMISQITGGLDKYSSRVTRFHTHPANGDGIKEGKRCLPTMHIGYRQPMAVTIHANNDLKTPVVKNDRKRLILPLAIVLLLSVCLQSCAKKFSFQNSAVVPAAEGKVSVKKDKSNNNYRIELKVMRLAKPERLTPSKDVYVVWLLSASNSAQNIGQLKTSSGMFSKTLKSYLKTVTSYNPSGFLITAEDKADVQYPGSQIVLRTDK